MTTWNYIIGNEKDFEGAPDWALYRAQVKLNGDLLDAWEGKDNRYCFTLESEGSIVKMKEYDDGGFINWGWPTKPTIVAQREPVKSVQWVYHLGTPEMFARMSEGVTHLFRNRLNGVVKGICSPDVIATYSARLDYELIGHRKSATDAAPAVTNDSKYNRPCKGISIDVYDVLKAFNVTCPALQHLIKKALAVGQRGHKGASEDLKDILVSAKRAIELSESNK